MNTAYLRVINKKPRTITVRGFLKRKKT